MATRGRHDRRLRGESRVPPEGVTRFRRDKPGSEGRRGTGTAEMIEFFQQLAPQHQAKMCLLSGSAHLLFDGTHRLTETTTIKGETRRTITFNRSGLFEDPPDSNFVRKIAGRFPGTIISLRFPIHGTS